LHNYKATEVRFAIQGLYKREVDGSNLGCNAFELLNALISTLKKYK